ncbi:MAG: class I mannose-6-phosphate isomerase [Flavobacteriaceae bacterium]|nr:class I mannose-6-phosphate isomerase [Bacteroidia bacterium]NNL15408.1 class I mannose-6-phosphate isomerase [Flavobacteriaceae bacterium]
MTDQLYPLKFKPILKERIWGGTKLQSFLKKKTNSNSIGESWEISDVEGTTSIVCNGKLEGTSLKDLQRQFKGDLVGMKNHNTFQNRFPLLIKFIDAKHDLSIQLHPNDALAAKRHNSFGKTEMWYVMQADKDANLIVDFNQEMNKDKYLHHLNNKSLPNVLNFEKVKEGDTYFIEVGRVHAIGAGVFLAEIQQTSDITYRVYDWDRVDKEGKTRELHNDLALDAINFDLADNYKVKYSKKDNVSNRMVTCPYFTTNYIEVNKDINKTNDHDSFVVYICVDGSASIKTEDYSEMIRKGETLLLPASIKNYSINSNSAKLLEVYI